MADGIDGINSAADVGEPPNPSLEDPCGEREAVRRRLLAGRAAGDGAGPAGPDAFDTFLSGRVFMDMIFTGLAGLPPPGTEFVTDGLGSAPGGVANIAIAMSRLGLRVGLAAAFGDDMFGAYLWRALSEQEGVGLGLSRRVIGWPTPVTVSLAYGTDRSLVTYTKPLPIPEDDLVVAAPPARICFIEVDRPVPDWAITMRGRGTTVFSDLGWDPTEAWSTAVLDRLRHVDVFLPNAVEAMAYTRTSSAEEALDALAARVPIVAIKLGGHGAIAADATTGERVTAPALPIHPLDPTGAGDVFAAGFAFGTPAGWPLA